MKLLLFLFISIQAFAQETTNFEYTRKIQKRLEEIKNLEPENFISQIDTYRADIGSYFEHKKRVCNGEFSTLILSEGQEPEKEEAKRLNKSERRLCFSEMKALQTTFINNIFLARKRYLEFLHKKRIQELSEAREESLKNLSKSFSKKSRR